MKDNLTPNKLVAMWWCEMKVASVLFAVLSFIIGALSVVFGAGYMFGEIIQMPRFTKHIKKWCQSHNFNV